MYNAIIYGIGGFTRRYLPITREFLEGTDINLIGFVDKAADASNCTFDGKLLHHPSELPRLSFDYIFIYAFDDKGLFQSIRKSLIVEYHIPGYKIGNIVDLLGKAQNFYRRNINITQTRLPKVYDCFQFYNEAEILHMRMEILNPYVDHFVIVEMPKDHHGRSKPLYFKECFHEFEKFKDKIIYYSPDEKDIPENRESERNEYGHIWTIEQYQRRCIANGLVDAQPEDIIMISDCDEIPNPSILTRIRENLEFAYPDVTGELLEHTAIALRQEYFYFFLNCRNKMRKNTTTIVKYKNMINPQIIRDVMNCLPYIDYGGWHLTYFGGPERIKQKISAIVEGTDVSESQIVERILNAKDIYGRVGEEFELEFLSKEQITIPYLESWINKYPSFYLDDDLKEKLRGVK